jgi:ferric-dicitrate binding protein FerR (iron transport regulator)
MTEQPEDPMDSALLLRYLDGGASASERQAVEDWRDLASTHREELEGLERAWNVSALLPAPDFDLDALWQRIRRQLDGLELAPAGALGAASVLEGDRWTPVAGDRKVVALRPKGGWRHVRIAVGGVLAAAAVVLAVLGIRALQPVVENALEGPMRTYAAVPGEVANIVLADGSKVVLSGASTLNVPPDFGEDTRDVYLDGEAYFDVAHDASRAFRVHTGRMTVEQRGTRFTVIGFADDPRNVVAVAEGVVEVTGKDSAAGVILNPDDVAEVSPSGIVSAKRNVSIEKYFSWVDGLVRFDQETVAEAALIIQRRFGINLYIADSTLARRRFTGTLRASSLYRDLRGLALLLDAKYERRGRDVVFSSQQAPPG